MAVANALFGQGIDVRGDGILMPIATENGTHVFGCYPENVGFAEREKRQDQKQRREW
jgi:hypothetical protein